MIAGREEDAVLLQFTAAYLRSTLARYFLMMRGWKMLCERNGVHLADVETFPFFVPEDAPDPAAARDALLAVQARMAELMALPELEQASHYDELRDEFDEEVFSYFGLSGEEQTLIRESVRVLMPSVRPRSFKSLDTPAQHRASSEDFGIYAQALADALTAWRTKARGQGRFRVDVVASDPNRAGPSGIVRISYLGDSTDKPEVSASMNDELVLATLAELRNAGLCAIPSGDFLCLVPDVHLWVDGALYLVRPLTKRNWTVRKALRDAEHIARGVQVRQSVEKGEATA